MRRFNDWLADKLAAALSTMWLFWALTLLVFAALLAQTPNGAQGWILFWVSIFFQGVALPVLAFVSNKQGDRMERVLRETHDAVLQELTEVKQMHAELSARHTRLVDGLNQLTRGRGDRR